MRTSTRPAGQWWQRRAGGVASRAGIAAIHTSVERRPHGVEIRDVSTLRRRCGLRRLKIAEPAQRPEASSRQHAWAWAGRLCCHGSAWAGRQGDTSPWKRLVCAAVFLRRDGRCNSTRDSLTWHRETSCVVWCWQLSGAALPQEDSYRMLGLELERGVS